MTERPIPTKLNTISTLQIVSGVINLALAVFMAVVAGVVGGGLSAFVVMCVGAFAGCPCPCPVGVVCGVWGLVYIPIAIGEIALGIYGLAGGQKKPRWSTWMAYAQIGHILVGAVGSLIVGLVTLALMADPDVQDYVHDLWPPTPS